jgi:hypothetical protein
MVCRKDVKAGGNCKKYEQCDKPCRAQCPLRVVTMDAFCSEWKYFPDEDETAAAVKTRGENSTISSVSTTNVPSTVAVVTMSSASVVSSTVNSILGIKEEIGKDKATFDDEVEKKESNSDTVIGNPDFGTHFGDWIAVFLALFLGVIFAVTLALLFCSTCAKLYGNFNEWVDRRTVRNNRDGGKKKGYENVDEETTPKRRQQVTKLYGCFTDWWDKRTVRRGKGHVDNNEETTPKRHQQHEKDVEGGATSFNVQQERKNAQWRQQIEDNMRRLREREEEKRREEIEKDNENYRRKLDEGFAKIMALQDRPRPAMMVTPPRTQPQV